MIKSEYSPFASGGVFLFLIAFPVAFAFAQLKSASVAKTPFALKNGDRVVFVGNALFENDLRYGYLEYSLTTRWPDQGVAFRNIGWTGDNVWGEVRN